MKMESKQVEVANADQGRLSELVTMPALAVLHRDLKVRIQPFMFPCLDMNERCSVCFRLIVQTIESGKRCMWGSRRWLCSSLSLSFPVPKIVPKRCARLR